MELYQWSPYMANTWILIRHPDKEGDAEGIYLGDKAQITPRGELQITDVLDRLKHWAEKPEIVLSSKLPRTEALALHVAEVLGIEKAEPNQLFNEIDKPQSLVGLRRNSREHERIMREVRRLFDQNRTPKGVSVKRRTQVQRDVREAFTHIENLPHDIALTVSHAKRIAAYVHWVWKGCKTLRGYYAETDRTLKFDTTGVTVLKRIPNRRTGRLHWHVQTINDTSHAGLPLTVNPEFAGLLGALDRAKK
jgi:broad specificity phosphatase PhoE